MVEREAALPDAIVVHAMPGRTRLRIPEKRHQAGYFQQLAERLAKDPRVHRVEVNPQTASVLIEHEGTVSAIAADLPLAIRTGAPPTRRVVRAGAAVSPRVAFSTGAAACVVLAAYQARRGRLLGSAAENLWNAYGAWRGMKMPQVAVLLAAGGMVQLARGPVLSPAVSLLFYALNMRLLARGRSEPAG